MIRHFFVVNVEHALLQIHSLLHAVLRALNGMLQSCCVANICNEEGLENQQKYVTALNLKQAWPSLNNVIQFAHKSRTSTTTMLRHSRGEQAVQYLNPKSMDPADCLIFSCIQPWVYPGSMINMCIYDACLHHPPLTENNSGASQLCIACVLPFS